MPESNLEKRVKRLEQIHIWGGGIVIVGVILYFALKTKK